MQAYTVAVVILTIAAACDLLTKKIPNLLIVSGYVIAFATMIILNGWSEAYIYLIRALLTPLALFIFYFLKALGAGDIKLFSVISVFCPTQILIRFIVCSLVIAALTGVVRLLIHRELRRKMHSVASHVKNCISTGVISHYIPEGESSYICFSVCMLIGFITSIGMEVLM